MWREAIGREKVRLVYNHLGFAVIGWLTAKAAEDGTHFRRRCSYGGQAGTLARGRKIGSAGHQA